MRSKLKHEGRTGALGGKKVVLWQEGWLSAPLGWHALKTQGHNIPYPFFKKFKSVPPILTKYNFVIFKRDFLKKKPHDFLMVIRSLLPTTCSLLLQEQPTVCLGCHLPATSGFHCQVWYMLTDSWDVGGWPKVWQLCALCSSSETCLQQPRLQMFRVDSEQREKPKTLSKKFCDLDAQGFSPSHAFHSIKPHIFPVIHFLLISAIASFCCLHSRNFNWCKAKVRTLTSSFLDSHTVTDCPHDIQFILRSTEPQFPHLQNGDKRISQVELI